MRILNAPWPRPKSRSAPTTKQQMASYSKRGGQQSPSMRFDAVATSAKLALADWTCTSKRPSINLPHVAQATHPNLSALREEQSRIRSRTRVYYPIMKLVDMYFWQVGYDRVNHP